MASRSLGVLTLDLVAKIGGFVAGLSQAEREADKRSKAIASKFKAIQTAAKTAFSAIGGASVIYGLANIAKQAIETGDELLKTATKTGLTGEAVSELAYAAKISDIELGSLTTSLVKMQRTLSEAASGAKAPQETLAALGLVIQDLVSLNADEKFELLAERISQLKDPADRARAAVELFGKAGADLLPLFEQGATGIRKAREEAEKYGQAFTTDQLQRLADADDAIKKLNASFDGLAVTLTAKIAPGITRLLDGLQKLQENAEKGTFWDRLKMLNPGYNIYNAFNPEEQNPTSTGFGGRSNGNTANGPLANRVAGFVDTDAIKKAADAAKKAAEEAAKAAEKAAKEALDETSDSIVKFINQTNEVIFDSAEKELKYQADKFEADEERYGLITRITAEIEKQADEAERSAKKASEFMLEFARNTQDILADGIFGAINGEFEDLPKRFKTMLDQLVAQALAAQLAEKLFGSISGGDKGDGGLLGKLGGFVKNLFGGGRAAGGSVNSGMLYSVNEGGEMEALSIPGRGDYLMTGRYSGNVTPADRLQGASGVTQNIYFQGRQDQHSIRQLELEAAQNQRRAQRLA